MGIFDGLLGDLGGLVGDVVKGIGNFAQTPFGNSLIRTGLSMFTGGRGGGGGGGIGGLFGGAMANMQNPAAYGGAYGGLGQQANFGNPYSMISSGGMNAWGAFTGAASRGGGGGGYDPYGQSNYYAQLTQQYAAQQAKGWGGDDSSDRNYDTWLSQQSPENQYYANQSWNNACECCACGHADAYLNQSNNDPGGELNVGDEDDFGGGFDGM